MKKVKLNQGLWSHCFGCHAGNIFGEYFSEVKNRPYTLKYIAKYIKKDVFGIGDEWWNESKMDYEEGDRELALMSLLEGSKDPEVIITAWNEFYQCNGESHGAIFGMLFYGKHNGLLNSLLKDLNGFDKYGIFWDT